MIYDHLINTGHAAPNVLGWAGDSLFPGSPCPIKLYKVRQHKVEI